jgi:hypothetical protein
MSANMNHGKTTSAKRDSGRKSTLTERDHHTLRRTVLKNHRTTAAQITVELNIHLDKPVATTTVPRELHAVPYIRKSVRLENTQGSLKSRMPRLNVETLGRFCDSLGSNTVVQYSFGPIITLHGRITAREYMDRLGNQVHSMIQMLFPKDDAVFQDDSAPFTQLELSSHGLKCMKVKFNTFQHH